MAEDTNRFERAHTPSGVAPVVFSASTEIHDVAVVATDRDAMRRSPFGTEAAAAAATGE
jgi:hypothetical protein